MNSTQTEDLHLRPEMAQKMSERVDKQSCPRLAGAFSPSSSQASTIPSERDPQSEMRAPLYTAKFLSIPSHRSVTAHLLVLSFLLSDKLQCYLSHLFV